MEGRQAAIRLTRRASKRVCDIRAHHVAWLYFPVTRDTCSHVVRRIRKRSSLLPLCYPLLRSIFPSFERVLCVKSFIDALLPYYIRSPSLVRGIRKHLTL